MKQITFLALFSIFTSFSQQELKFEIRDGLYSTPLEDAIVYVKNMKNNKVDSIYLNEKTEYIFKTKKKAVFEIAITHPSGNYKYRVFKTDKIKYLEYIIYLYPTEEYEAVFMAEEAEKYPQPVTAKILEDSFRHQEVNDFTQFVSSNIVFPLDDFFRVQKKVYVGCNVQLDGQLTDVRIMVTSDNYLVDAEVKRVIRNAQKLKEGTQIINLFLSIPVKLPSELLFKPKKAVKQVN